MVVLLTIFNRVSRIFRRRRRIAVTGVNRQQISSSRETGVSEVHSMSVSIAQSGNNNNQNNANVMESRSMSRSGIIRSRGGRIRRFNISVIGENDIEQNDSDSNVLDQSLGQTARGNVSVPPIRISDAAVASTNTVSQSADRVDVNERKQSSLLMDPDNSNDIEMKQENASGVVDVINAEGNGNNNNRNESVLSIAADNEGSNDNNNNDSERRLSLRSNDGNDNNQNLSRNIHEMKLNEVMSVSLINVLSSRNIPVEGPEFEYAKTNMVRAVGGVGMLLPEVEMKQDLSDEQFVDMFIRSVEQGLQHRDEFRGQLLEWIRNRSGLNVDDRDDNNDNQGDENMDNANDNQNEGPQ